MLPFSVLDLAPIVQGGDAAGALRSSRELAVHCEALDYRRYWLAEHHNMPGIASAATAIVIAHVAAATSAMRVGAGGIMLPNHAPLMIAEQFGTLDALFPGRIDLGLGRAPGTDPRTAHALRRTLTGDVDKCPQVPGVAPDGCPPPDTDGDGIIDANDKCIQEPESKNNYQDADGCPDDVPKAVVKFSGVIKGIYFDVDKDTIKKNSKKTLDESIAVLKEHKEVRLEISGHTDSDGNRDHNIDLSARRAEAVRKYQIDAGIDAGRLTSRGAGPDEPVADNKTKAGKALNRRIEFKLLGGAGDVGVK